MLSLIQQYDMIPKGSRVLCALSGGLDSVYLFYRLYHLQSILDFTLCAAHFNHQLRGEESQRDEAFVRSFVEKYGGNQRVNGISYPPIPLVVGGADVATEAKGFKQGIEETARQLRYQFLEETAQKLDCNRIATAHHADDNLETVLLHLVRGTGLQGLAGISPLRGKLMRPLLTTTRKFIESQVHLYDLPYVEDSSNTCLDYSRNKLRHQVIPILAEINPQIVTTSVENIEHLRQDNRYLRQIAREKLMVIHNVENYVEMWATQLGCQSDPIAHTMARLLLEDMGVHQFSSNHLKSLVQLCRSEKPSASVNLPQGLMARRVYDKLILEQSQEQVPPSPVEIEIDRPQLCQFGDWSCEIYPVTMPPQPETGFLYLALDQVTAPILLRTRQTGDQLALAGRPNRSLKKLLIDRKIPRVERDFLPVLADQKGVLCVGGLGVQSCCIAQPGQRALAVSLTQHRPKETNVNLGSRSEASFQYPQI